LYEITFEQFARLFEFGWNDANHIKIHFASCLDGSMMRFMYLAAKGEYWNYFRLASLLCLLEPSFLEDDDS
jgi:hypothetical protein